MNTNNKQIILTFIGNYLPGYKAGGILRVLVNTVDYLCDEFEFKIITNDRDLGDKKPFDNIQVNNWQQVGNAEVYYLSPESNTLKSLSHIIKNTPHNVLYLNSFFDPFTIKTLLIRKLFRITSKPIILAPWGEFGWASFKQKLLKKIIFIILARIIGLYQNVMWRASSELEKQDIIKIMNINPNDIKIIYDLPIKNKLDVLPDLNLSPPQDYNGLKIVFLSRISREKNLDYALKVLQKVTARVLFDLYGPAENINYWNDCQELINQLPGNIQVNYKGSVNPNQVVNIFSNYDLFLFPSGGEAYGHVIAECLIAGTPVLISTETPWRDLQIDGLGWDIDLKHIDSFVEIIEKLALKSIDERIKMRDIIKTKIVGRLLDPAVLESNRNLFKEQLS